MRGERGDVDSKCVNDWICEGYETRDIFDIDETKLYFRDRNRTLVAAGTVCAGRKSVKQQEQQQQKKKKKKKKTPDRP